MNPSFADISHSLAHLPHIQLLQIQICPGEPQKNAQAILAAYLEACAEGAQICIAPELAIPGYLIGDLWEDTCFIRDCAYFGEWLKSKVGSTVLIFGNVALEKSQKGENGRERLYNAAWVAQNQNWLNNPSDGSFYFAKTLLPNYRCFDDSRYFYDLRKRSFEENRPLNQYLIPLEISLTSPEKNHNIRVGITLCEDAWSQDYGFSVAEILAHQGIDFLVNLSCSPYSKEKNQKRNLVFSTLAQTIQVPVFYCNGVGIQNNLKTIFPFDGSSAIYSNSQHISLPPFSAARLSSSSQKSTQEQILSPSALFLPKNPNTPPELQKIEQSALALLHSTREYMEQSKLKKVVIGASGGIDSAVAAALFCAVLGPENVLLANMPSEWNSNTTKNLANELAQNLGVFQTVVSISESVNVTKSQIHQLQIQNGTHSQTLELKSFHLENIQARDRSSRILAALAAAWGAVFSCNANKAETTVGYSTLYGDHGGFLAPLADLWKHEVYALGEWFNQVYFGQEVIPQGTFTIPPSAELGPQHNVDLGMGDPIVYWYHDFLFQSWIEPWNRLNIEDCLELWAKGTLEKKLGLKQSLNTLFKTDAEFIADLEKWWVLFKGMGVAKRVQAPPIIALSKRSFGFDFRESLMPVHFSARYLQIKSELLQKEAPLSI